MKRIPGSPLLICQIGAICGSVFLGCGQWPRCALLFNCLPVFLSLLSVCSQASAADAWPQYRGPRGSGVADAANKLPAELGPETNVLWKVPLPPGHSSPVVVGERIFVTAVRDKQLLTMGLDRATGNVVWECESAHETLEKIHGIGSYAQPSPATDGERVFSFFGSSGLYCYSVAGTPLWNLRMGPFNNDFGAGTSPILVDDRLIMVQDHDQDSFLTALDKKTGKQIWKTDRSEFPRNYCTPVLWEVGGQKQIVVAATLRVVGYDFATGHELWTVRGLSRMVCMTPVVGPDGLLYVAGWSAGGDPGERIQIGPFEEAIASDKNGNGLLEENELPDGAIKTRYTQVDRDKSGSITREEYEYFRGLFDKAPMWCWPSSRAVRGTSPPRMCCGNTPSTSLFAHRRSSIRTSCSPSRTAAFSPRLDARTGKALKEGRLQASGDYYSSPVAADDKVFLLNVRGQLTVISAQGKWEVLHTADFSEDAYATPAIADNRLYLRTAGHLYCLGVK